MTVTLLKAIEDTIHVDLIVSLNFLDFILQFYFLFAPEMSASLKSHIVPAFYIVLSWIMYPLHFSLLPLI